MDFGGRSSSTAEAAGDCCVGDRTRSQCGGEELSRSHVLKSSLDLPIISWESPPFFSRGFVRKSGSLLETLHQFRLKRSDLTASDHIAVARGMGSTCLGQAGGSRANSASGYHKRK